MKSCYIFEVAQSRDFQSGKIIPVEKMKWEMMGDRIFMDYDGAQQIRFEEQQNLSYHIIRVKKLSPLKAFWMTVVNPSKYVIVH